MTTTPDRLLTPEDILAKLNISRSKLYMLLGQANFPQPVKIGQHNRWPEREVLAWIAEQPRGTIGSR